jgi:hypothetical protein
MKVATARHLKYLLKSVLAIEANGLHHDMHRHAMTTTSTRSSEGGWSNYFCCWFHRRGQGLALKMLQQLCQTQGQKFQVLYSPAALSVAVVSCQRAVRALRLLLEVTQN